MSTSITVAVISLGGSPIKQEFPDTTPLYRVIYELQHKTGPFGNINLICSQRKVEDYGLATPIGKLPSEHQTVNFYKTINLGAYGYVMGTVVGLLNKARQLAVDAAVVDDSSIPLNETRIRNLNSIIDELRDTFNEAKSKTITNDKDVITLDDIDSVTAMRWIEGDKVFALPYDSLMTYVKSFKYTDDNGKMQIPNPYTKVNIASPWREEFLNLASR